jgi:hypothetical protein
MLALSIIALILGFVGSLILALCLGSFFSSIALALNSHEVAINSLADRNGPVPTGSVVHVEKSARKFAGWTILGLLMLAASRLLKKHAWS